MDYTFTSEKARYAYHSNPDEHLHFIWDSETGTPKELKWYRAADIDPHEWYLFESDPGSITPEGNFFNIDLRITSDPHPHQPFALKGKLMRSTGYSQDGATFGAVLEGTGTAWWLVADGTLNPM